MQSWFDESGNHFCFLTTISVLIKLINNKMWRNLKRTFSELWKIHQATLLDIFILLPPESHLRLRCWPHVKTVNHIFSRRQIYNLRFSFRKQFIQVLFFNPSFSNWFISITNTNNQIQIANLNNKRAHIFRFQIFCFNVTKKQIKTNILDEFVYLWFKQSCVEWQNKKPWNLNKKMTNFSIHFFQIFELNNF